MGREAARGSLRGGEQEPVAFISCNLGQNLDGAGGARVGQLLVSRHLMQGPAEQAAVTFPNQEAKLRHKVKSYWPWNMARGQDGKLCFQPPDP